MPERLLLRVKVQPRARRNAVGPYASGLLQVHVTTAPERGKANEAVVELVAEYLGLPKRALQITRGLASREKWVTVAGLTQTELERRLSSAE